MLNLFLEYPCLTIQSCPTVCDPVACGPQGFSIHGDSPGKITGVGCHALLQGSFPTQGLNPGLTHCRWILLECLLVPFTFSLALLSQPTSPMQAHKKIKNLVGELGQRKVSPWSFPLPSPLVGPLPGQKMWSKVILVKLLWNVQSESSED